MAETITLDIETLQRWMTIYLATIIGDPVESLDVLDPISEYDLDSIDAINMAITMEKKFSIQVHPETFLQSHMSISDITNNFC